VPNRVFALNHATSPGEGAGVPSDLVLGPGNRTADDASVRMGRAWRELGRAIGRTAQLDLLELLTQRSDWRMSDLAAALHVDPSAVTRTLQRMEAAGLATRSAGNGDGRVVIVRATTRGRQRYADVAARRMEILDEVLNELPEADRYQLVELLERFVAALDDHVAAEASEARR
jgi:DNA-binding MarR family transcriptional regulator